MFVKCWLECVRHLAPISLATSHDVPCSNRQFDYLFTVCSCLQQRQYKDFILLSYCEGNSLAILTGCQSYKKRFHIMTASCLESIEMLKTGPWFYINSSSRHENKTVVRVYLANDLITLMPLLPCTKPSPEPNLTYHRNYSVAFACEEFHKNYSWT